MKLSREPARVSKILPSVRPLQRYFARKADPLTNVFLVLPLFLVYQVGLLTQFQRTAQGYYWIGNGADFLTGTVLYLSHGSPLVYGLTALAITVVLGAMILRARRQSELHPRLFAPILAESAVYATLTAGTIGYVVDRLGLGVLDTKGLLAQVVASCGAGLHEELVFRVGLFGGLSYLLGRRYRGGVRGMVAVAIAVGFSSAVFALVHYLGPLGDRFELDTFAFRFFCGCVFALIFRTRGFAVAAWTHCLYDILYFSLKRW